MHPAFSVIFLTTLIGVGQGLFLALFTGQSYAAVGFIEVQQPARFYALGSVLAFAFLTAGLGASFFHLGRPERGWRSIAQWRTSWLSREVLILPAFMMFVALYGAIHFLGWDPVVLPTENPLQGQLSLWVGALGAFLAFALFIATGMIYACLKFLQEWASPLTVVNYTLLGGASGFTLAAAYAAWQAPDLVSFYGVWAALLTVAALITRTASLIRNARLTPKSTVQTAIGVRHSRVQQKSQGLMGGSVNTRDFFHHAPVAVFHGVKWTFLLLVFVLPLGLLWWGLRRGSLEILSAAFLVQYIGLIAERWFFFAQANHPQNLYYQTVG